MRLNLDFVKSLVRYFHFWRILWLVLSVAVAIAAIFVGKIVTSFDYFQAIPADASADTILKIPVAGLALLILPGLAFGLLILGVLYPEKITVRITESAGSRVLLAFTTLSVCVLGGLVLSYKGYIHGDWLPRLEPLLDVVTLVMGAFAVFGLASLTYVFGVGKPSDKSP